MRDGLGKIGVEVSSKEGEGRKVENETPIERSPALRRNELPQKVAKRHKELKETSGGEVNREWTRMDANG
jgi:hypothetical protein